MTHAGAGGRVGVAIALMTIFTLSCSMPRADDRVESGVFDAVVVSDTAVAPPGVMARVVHGPNGFEVEGRFRVAASREVAWAVLTDYDGIDRFVSSMRESRIAGRGDGYVLVEQVAVGRLFLFKRRMRTTLRVHEEPPGRIRFEDVLRKDFERYQGEWRIEDLGHEVEIVYEVQARPAGSMPGFVARGMFERTVHQLLSELQKEIVSRAALAERRP